MAASAYRAPTVHRLPPNAIPESSPSPYSLTPDINGVSETFTHAGLPVSARAVGAAAATNSHPSLRPPAHSLSPYRPSCLVARRLPHLQLRQPQYVSQLGRLRLPSVSNLQCAENCSPSNYLWEHSTSCGLGSIACTACKWWVWVPDAHADARPPFAANGRTLGHLETSQYLYHECMLLHHSLSFPSLTLGALSSGSNMGYKNL